MEDNKKYIYYRINSHSNPNYYIIELQKDEDFKIISFEKIFNLLVEEAGFEESYLSLINSIQYRFDENDKLVPLKHEVDIQNNSKIYIELEINQITSTPNNDDDENEYYQTNIDELEKEIKKINLDCSSKTNFNNKNSKKKEISQGKKNAIRIYGINQNINFNRNNDLVNNNISENNNKINVGDKENNNQQNGKEIKIFYLYSYPIDKNNREKLGNQDEARGFQLLKNKDALEYNYKNENENQINYNKERINNENENQINYNKERINNENENIINNNKKDDENLKNHNDLYEENIYYAQMFLLYEKIKESEINANLIFEPIYDNFDYLEKMPDILHMKVNSFVKKSPDKNEVYIDLELNWQIDSQPFFNVINDLSCTKLFILSTQNIEFFEKSFEEKKEIKYNNIFLINSSKISEEQENSFISKLYELLLKGSTIEEAINQSKKESKIINDKSIIRLINKEKKIEDLSIQNYNKDKKINLNKNCLLNLDFIKYNYSEYKKYYKMMLNRDMEIKEYKNYFVQNKNKVCVFGEEGVGKKMFVQKVGYYFYERKKFDNVYYLELYSLDSTSKNILKLKIKEIITNNHKVKEDDNRSEFDPQKNLILVYFKYAIKEKHIKLLEQIIGELNYTFFFIFAFTIKKIKENKEKIINFSSIQLGKLDKLQQIKLFKKCINSKVNVQNIDIIFKDDIKLPYNEIYLRALYINLFEKREIKNLSTEEILEKIIELDYKDDNNEKSDIKKILAYFSILKFGISSEKKSEKIIDLKEEEKRFIKEKLNYIIYSEKNENETIYCIDNSFSEKIIKILIEKHNGALLIFLNSIFEYYSSVFRYFIFNSNFPYDICMQFHPAINNDFWNNKNNKKNKSFDLYFDDALYSNNIFSLFNYKEERYENIVAKEKQKLKGYTNCNLSPTIIYNFNEYIGQIALYLSTILHFKNSFIYRDFILDFFLFEFYKSYKDQSLDDPDMELKIKLKIIKYWTSEKSKLNFNVKDEELSVSKLNFNAKDEEIKKIKMENIKIELILLKIYDYIIKKKTEDISDIFDKAEKIIKENDYLNLSRLYTLYGTYLNDIIYLKKAKEYGKKAENSYLELNAELKQIELLIKNNEFNEANERKEKCNEEIDDRINKKNDKNLKNSDIKDKINDILKLYDTSFDNHIKNKLYFFTSTPYYDENKVSLKTESNNSFYLKYKLSNALPNLQFEFKKIDKDLKELGKCLQYPIKFLYIGSDDFNENGNICYSDGNFISHFIDNKIFSEIIENSKCKESCDIVILGIINGNSNNNNNNLFQILKQNKFRKFRHIVYFNKVTNDSFYSIIKNSPYNIYFKKNFFNFIKEFLLYLSKSRGYLTIKEAFRRANNNFNDAMKYMEIGESFKGCSDLNILCMDGDAENDGDICDFGTFNDENNNRVLNANKKDIYDEYDDEDMKRNNIYFRKNPFVDEKQNEDIISGKKKFWKFPRKGYLREENFNRFIEKGIYSMKDILRDIIKNVKKYNFCNVYGNEYKGKTKVCEEVCKHFFMNEELFKKGIFVFDLRYFNAVKNQIPELNNIINSKKKKKKNIN